MIHTTILLGLFLFFHLVCADNDTVIHGWVREPSGRGTWSILWSSLATISLCTWSALHLSVPKYHERWKLVLRRCKYFSIALLAPEVILILTLGSFVDARNAVLDLQQFGGPQWTMVHAQFLFSGGFKIVKPGPTYDPDDDGQGLRELVKWGIVRQPPLSSDELQSRSKSDWLVKLIAILQISYFASQTVFRALQHLQVTPLEILVVSFIFCSLLSYAFNWSKPQDVEYPVIIQLEPDWQPYKNSNKPRETEIVTADNSMTEAAAPQNDIPQPNALQEQKTQPDIPQPTGPQQPERRSSFQYTPFQLRAMGPVPVPAPYEPITAPIESRPPQDTLESVRWPGPYDPALDPREPKSRLAKLLFSKGIKARGFFSICVILSTSFGAIHCAGWHSPFPSHAEMVIWRVCAVMITALPTPWIWLLRLYLEVRSYRVPRHIGKLRNVIIFLGGLYVVARVMLIVLAFTTLRALPAETYETVEWTRYLPNFSS